MSSSSSALRLAFLLVIATTGCVRISTLSLNQPAATAIPVDSVRVFVTNAPAAYTEVAVLRSRRFLAGERRTLDAFRERAARLGANGVLLIGMRGDGRRTQTGTGVVIGGQNDGSVIVANGTSDPDEFERVVAIRWTAPAAGTQAVARPTP